MNPTWKRVDWREMSADRWLMLAMMAKEEEDLELMASLVYIAFRNGRHRDERIVHFMMEIADQGSYADTTLSKHIAPGCGCKTCIWPELNGGPEKCPRMQLRKDAMKALVLGVLHLRREDGTDRSVDSPLDIAPYAHHNGATVKELVEFVWRNISYLLDHQSGAFAGITRGFLRWIYKGASYRMVDLYPLFCAMITSGIEGEITEPTTGAVETLERIFHRDDKPGDPSMELERALNSSNPLTRKAAERVVVLVKKAEGRFVRPGATAADPDAII